MSHFTTIETQIKDIGALRCACAELDLLLLENASARGYGMSKRTADYVIRLRGPYDVALDRGEAGVYSLTTDWWGGHVERELGPRYGRLLQTYGVHKVSIEARRRGCRVRRSQREDGTIQLCLEGGAV